LNKSEGIDFFSVKESTDTVVLDENTLFFYPIDNNQGQSMPEPGRNIEQQQL
jgi:hypothetical protein